MGRGPVLTPGAEEVTVPAVDLPKTVARPEDDAVGQIADPAAQDVVDVEFAARVQHLANGFRREPRASGLSGDAGPFPTHAEPLTIGSRAAFPVSGTIE